MKNCSNLTIILLLLVGLSGCNFKSTTGKNPSTMKEIATKEEMKIIYDGIKKEFARLTPQVIQPAEGYLKYPYLIPAGFYKQMWDWDGFFMANHFISQDKPEYMQYWALNLIEGIDDEGYVSGCANTKGPRPIFGKFSMKPFLSQGVYFASEKLGDYTWIKDQYNDLKKVLKYREKTQQDNKTGLFFWDNAMQSGADNNPAMNYFWKEDHRRFLSCDASAWQYREYQAQAIIAKKLGYEKDANVYANKASNLKEAMNEILWCPEDQVFYNVDNETGNYYKRVSYSSFVPLLAGIASQEQGKNMITKYLISSDHMKAAFGFRSLSKQDPDYNNKNIIVPFSNWQGPVWPIANYIYSIGLKNYGFDTEVKWLASTLGQLLLDDINEWDSMHENYHADTGKPLAPAATHVDKNGKFVGFISWNLCIQNVLAGVVEDKWMLLEIK